VPTFPYLPLLLSLRCPLVVDMVRRAWLRHNREIMDRRESDARIRGDGDFQDRKSHDLIMHDTIGSDRERERALTRN